MLKDCWKSEVKEEEMPPVWVLLEKICEMKKAGVSGATVMLSWLQRRIQILQQRTHFRCQYTGATDSSRITLGGFDGGCH